MVPVILKRLGFPYYDDDAGRVPIFGSEGINVVNYYDDDKPSCNTLIQINVYIADNWN